MRLPTTTFWCRKNAECRINYLGEKRRAPSREADPLGMAGSHHRLRNSRRLCRRTVHSRVRVLSLDAPTSGGLQRQGFFGSSFGAFANSNVRFGFIANSPWSARFEAVSAETLVVCSWDRNFRDLVSLGRNQLQNRVTLDKEGLATG